MDRAEEINFINDTDAWPNWPFLPVKNLSDRKQGFPRAGVIHAAQPTVVRLVNLFTVSMETWAAAERFEYEDLEALLDAGWVVD